MFEERLSECAAAVQVRLDRDDVVVYDAEGSLVTSQINPLAESDRNLFEPMAAYRLFFVASKLAPLSFTTFFVNFPVQRS